MSLDLTGIHCPTGRLDVHDQNATQRAGRSVYHSPQAQRLGVVAGLLLRRAFGQKVGAALPGDCRSCGGCRGSR
jgi:hypothetical protein